MHKQDVIAFFDHCAPTWDQRNVTNDAVIGRILDNAHVTAGTDVLDIACGTGVLFPYYLRRNVASVTGIDISSRMVEIAAEKWREEARISVLCADADIFTSQRSYDAIVVYNALPHFVNPSSLIVRLTTLLKKGGRLTVAHGASREAIDRCHKGAAQHISNGLMSVESLYRLFTPHLHVDTVISDDTMYQVCGVKK